MVVTDTLEHGSGKWQRHICNIAAHPILSGIVLFSLLAHHYHMFRSILGADFTCRGNRCGIPVLTVLSFVQPRLAWSLAWVL